jgi:hypothetical protein
VCYWLHFGLFWRSVAVLCVAYGWRSGTSLAGLSPIFAAGLHPLPRGGAGVGVANAPSALSLTPRRHYPYSRPFLDGDGGLGAAQRCTDGALRLPSLFKST